MMRTPLAKKWLLACVGVFAAGCSAGVSTSPSPTVDSAKVKDPPPVQIDGLGLLAAKPGEVVEVSGQNLVPGLKATLGKVTVDLDVQSPESASFVMPDGVGIGLVDVTFTSGTSTIKTIALVSYSAGDELPITLMAPELVCKDISFRNAKGEVKKGLRDCTSTTLADCAQDGQTNCRANDAIKGASVAGLASKVMSGATVAGVAGTAPTRPQDCATDGATDCVAVAGFPAAKLASFDATKILVGTMVGGVAGSLTMPAACVADGASGCIVDGTTYKAVKLSNFTDSDVRSGVTIAGVAGSLAGAPASCAADGAIGCLANASFKAADMSHVTAANVRSGVTIAGVAGGYPSALHPLVGADATPDLPAFASATGGTTYEWFKADGTRLTGQIQADANVTPGTTAQTFNAGLYRSVTVAGDASLVSAKIKSGETIFGVSGSVTPSPAACAADGAGSCVVDGSTYKAAKLSNFDDTKILTGTTVAGIAGSASPRPSDCNTDGATGCVAVTNFPAVDKVGALQANAASIRSSVTLAGVSGTLGNCAANGSQSCYATGTYKAATTCSASGSDCYLPSYAVTTQPLKALSYDAIDASKMLTTLTLGGITGTVDLTNLSAGNVKDSVTIGGVTGNYGPACASDGQQSCLASGSYKALNPASIDAAKMLTSQTLLGVSGVISTCGSDGASGCYVPSYIATTQPYKAIDYDNINTNKAKIRTSLTVAGLAGTLADCSSDGGMSCVTVTGYPAAKVGTSNLDERNIKNGVTIGGVAGLYPSSTYPLPSAGSGGVTIDLDTASFDARMKSSTQFQWWDSAGVRYTHSGDADIVDTNIVSGVNIFGTDGAASGGGGSPSAWDLRAGVTVGGVTGKLKVNCRNGGSTATWDGSMPKAVTVDQATDQFTLTGHGYATGDTVRVSAQTAPGGITLNSTTYYAIAVDANTFKLATSSANATGGTAIDVTSNGTAVTVFKWGNGTLDTADTLDDYNNGGAVLTAHPWSSDDYFCGGVEASSGDSNVWKDVTTGGCDGTKCRYKDKISGLEWTKTQSTAMSWGAAMDLCNTLTFDGVTGWRLPTQKELMDANVHGIRSAANANWITTAHMDNYFWSSSTRSAITTYAWIVNLSSGLTFTNNNKTSTFYVACVR